ncbi:MAG: hypothetical protein ACRCWR_08530 [Saezia sp.]
MENNVRRNRNIGTAKQGHGQDNRLTIPYPYLYKDTRYFVERLGKYKKQTHEVNGHEFVFVIEELREDCYYPCTPEDIAHLMAYVPVTDLGNLRLIVFRQPKRKEAILSPVWARLIYDYRFEGKTQPAIILEAFSKGAYLKWSKSLTVDDQNEFDRLKIDGHVFEADARWHKTTLTPENTRNTQLYRSFLHEWGHYAHFLGMVEEPSIDATTRAQHYQFYMGSITHDEKEKFAHNYADRLKAALIEQKVIPFK